MISLSLLDTCIIIVFFVVSLLIGLYSARIAGKSASSFFLSGRDMPWWLLGISMVATTFSADTPNLVTDIVRKDGISGNWVWWAFLLTGMLTVFVYSKLWRRTGFLTDLEFYEERYSGKTAAFLRVFRAFYLGVVFNVLVMATVCLAGIKIGSVLLGFSPMQTILLVSLVTVFYSAVGGLRGIILTDMFQFVLAMIGTIWAAWFIVHLPQIGGMENLLSHEMVADKLDFIPDRNNKEAFYALFLIPLAVQWWASYYPGAEPGGGGYVAQRMLSARSESHALSATLLFNVAHYALRPWPWILIALASLIVFPDLESLQQAFPEVNADIINDDLAYPAMLSFLPNGLLGIVVASLIAALMSTLSTHLNWGSSYVTNDIYKRVINKDATQETLVRVGRLVTVALMVLAAMFSLLLSNALEAFNIILLIGAGTGLIFILRWFWWRINSYSEIAAMVCSFIMAVYLEKWYGGEMVGYEKMMVNVGVTTFVWIAVMFLTPQTDEHVLQKFYNKIRPCGIGWGKYADQSHSAVKMPQRLGSEIIGMLGGSIMVYGLLFFIGYVLLGKMASAGSAGGVVLLGFIILMFVWKQVSGKN